MNTTVATPLLDTIEPDEPSDQVPLTGNINGATTPRQQVVLTPGTKPPGQTATTPSDAESGAVIR